MNQKEIQTWLQKWKLQLCFFLFFLNSAIKCLQYLQKQVFSITAVVSNISLLKDRYEDNFSM